MTHDFLDSWDINDPTNLYSNHRATSDDPYYLPFPNEFTEKGYTRFGHEEAQAA